MLRAKNVDILKQLGVVVWLDGNEETLFERASRARTRPLLQGENPREAFAQMLQARLPLYAKLGHIRIDTSVLTDDEVAVAILSKLRRLNQEPEIIDPGYSAMTQISRSELKTHLVPLANPRSGGLQSAETDVHELKRNLIAFARRARFRFLPHSCLRPRRRTRLNFANGCAKAHTAK